MKESNLSLNFEDNFSEFSIYPLRTEEYIEYFKNNPNDSFKNPSPLLSLYIDIIKKRFNKKQIPYLLLKVIPKKLTLAIPPRKIVTLDLTTEIGNGLLLDIEYQSLEPEHNIKDEKLLQIHGNSPIRERYSKIKKFYRYTTVDNKYINNIYLIKIFYISEKDYKDLCIKQLLEAYESLCDENYTDTILKCQISNEITAKNICKHENLNYNRRNYPDNLDIIKNNISRITLSQEILDILKEINTVRNNIIYRKGHQNLTTSKVENFIISSLIFYEYSNSLNYI